MVSEWLPLLKDWLPTLGVVAVAVISYLATTRGQNVQRGLSTKELNVKSDLAQIEAIKVNLTDKELQAKRELMAIEATERMGKLYNGLLAEATAHMTRQDEKIAGLEARIADCECRLMAALRQGAP